MTVDDIEVAQFIYLLINNEKIKSMIDTMRTKTVLILGSFDRHSLIVLDALKDAIREHDRLPVLINFDKPEKHELMETVKTMALLSSFIIVDLSIRSGQLHELSRLVPDTYIPFVTIAAKGTKLTAMQNEFKHHYWYKSKYFQYSKECRNEEIPELFETKILPWAEKINEKLRKKRMS